LTHLIGTLSRYRFEVISADSRQVYRGFDIGTAKPDAREREAVTYHLVDILDGTSPFDAGQFVDACDRLVPEIEARGTVPILSGGTAFYLERYLFGLPRTPPVHHDVRARLEERLVDRGLEELRRELAGVDPPTEQRIGRNDAYRVVRALEVYETTGKPLSEFEVPRTIRTGLSPLIIGLSRPRDELYRRINRRVRLMMDAGLVREVEGLLAKGYTLNDPAMGSIGYREFPEVAGSPPWTEDQIRAVEERIARNSRRYAKRQELFFRRIPDVHWIHGDDDKTLVATVSEWLQSHTDR
jgi:tRNA dimethylallyltransferase